MRREVSTLRITEKGEAAKFVSPLEREEALVVEVFFFFLITLTVTVTMIGVVFRSDYVFGLTFSRLFFLQIRVKIKQKHPKNSQLLKIFPVCAGLQSLQSRWTPFGFSLVEK